MVFYLKYRPQKIFDLDLMQVRERLYAILKNPDIPHAFLFTGTKGLGKTSTARILAKAINCKKNTKGSDLQADLSDTDFEPCNKCRACVSITNGASIDVLEIDAASNRGIDEIRTLRERVKYAPSELSKKVYIIDEVHMLTTEAFNALLKTLEEPPPHVIFILCTTEISKVLPTIVSRTFHIPFEKPSKEELTRSLERVAKGEKLSIEKEVYERLYELSEGSFRDATKILEELVFAAGSSKKITPKILEAAYHSESIEKAVAELLKALGERKVKEALSVIKKLTTYNVDFKTVNEKIVDALRIELFIQAGVSKGKLETSLSISDIEKLLELFNESYKNLKFSVIPQLPMEIAIIMWCFPQEAKNGATVQNIEQEKHVVKEVSVAVAQAVHDKSNKHTDFFYKLIDAVKQDNHTIAGILRGCTLTKVDKNGITIEAKYKFHGERLSETKARKIIESKAGEILGKNVALTVQIP